jgi:hypothetical protein
MRHSGPCGMALALALSDAQCVLPQYTYRKHVSVFGLRSLSPVYFAASLIDPDINP